MLKEHSSLSKPGTSLAESVIAWGQDLGSFPLRPGKEHSSFKKSKSREWLLRADDVLELEPWESYGFRSWEPSSSHWKGSGYQSWPLCACSTVSLRCPMFPLCSITWSASYWLSPISPQKAAYKMLCFLISLLGLSLQFMHDLLPPAPGLLYLLFSWPFPLWPCHQRMTCQSRSNTHTEILNFVWVFHICKQCVLVRSVSHSLLFNFSPISTIFLTQIHMLWFLTTRPPPNPLSVAYLYGYK